MAGSTTTKGDLLDHCASQTTGGQQESTKSRPTEAGAKERGAKNANFNNGVKIKLEDIKRVEAKIAGPKETTGDFEDICADQNTGGLGDKETHVQGKMIKWHKGVGLVKKIRGDVKKTLAQPPRR